MKQFLEDLKLLLPNSDDWTGKILLGTIIFMIVGMLFITALAIKGSYEESTFLERNSCNLVKESPTGRRVYCGKACTRKQIQYTYICQTFPEPLLIIK